MTTTATETTMIAQECIAKADSTKRALRAVTEDMRTLEFIIDCQQRYIQIHEPRNGAAPDATWLEFKRNADTLLAQWDNLKMIRDELKSRAK